MIHNRLGFYQHPHNEPFGFSIMDPILKDIGNFVSAHDNAAIPFSHYFVFVGLNVGLRVGFLVKGCDVGGFGYCDYHYQEDENR